MLVPPTAQAYYEAALAHMRALTQPAYVAYTAKVREEDDHVSISRDTKDGTLDISISLGRGSGTSSYSEALRASDETTSTQLADGTHALTHSGILNPTWWGAYRMMRDGWGAWGDPSPTPAPPAHRASPEPDDVPTIAVVKAISAGFYRIEDGGAAFCASGEPAHRVHLIAYRDPLDHPLTDAIIDTRTQEFCSLRFGLHQSAVIGSATGEMVLDFRHVGQYQVISDSDISVDLHAMGFKVKHLGVNIAYSDFGFPASVPDAAFEPQVGVKASSI